MQSFTIDLVIQYVSKVVQYSKQIEDNSPRSDDGDDVKPLERIRKVEKQVHY